MQRVYVLHKPLHCVHSIDRKRCGRHLDEQGCESWRVARARRRGQGRPVHRYRLVRHQRHALRGPERGVRLRARQLRELRRERRVLRLHGPRGHGEDLRAGGGTQPRPRLDADLETRFV